MLGTWSLNVLVLHETLLAPVLSYCIETTLWKEKEKSRTRAVQMDNLRGLLLVLRGWIESGMLR